MSQGQKVCAWRGKPVSRSAGGRSDYRANARRSVRVRVIAGSDRDSREAVKL